LKVKLCQIHLDNMQDCFEEDKAEINENTLWNKELKDLSSTPVVATRSSQEELIDWSMEQGK
jgi:hypothetical protein